MLSFGREFRALSAAAQDGLCSLKLVPLLPLFPASRGQGPWVGKVTTWDGPWLGIAPGE